MKPFFLTSLSIHALLIAWWMGPSLFLRNQLGWGGSYGIDFMGGPPGASGSPIGAPSKTEEKQQKESEEKKGKKADPNAWKIDKKGTSAKETKGDDRTSEKSSEAKNGKSGSGGSGSGVGIGFGASGGGLENFPYAWYVNILRTRLWEQWGSPGGEDAVQIARVRFVIERSGKIGDIVLEDSSGSGAYDQLALRAVAYASPLPPLPGGYSKSNLTVHVEFRVKP